MTKVALLVVLMVLRWVAKTVLRMADLMVEQKAPQTVERMVVKTDLYSAVRLEPLLVALTVVEREWTTAGLLVLKRVVSSAADLVRMRVDLMVASLGVLTAGLKAN